MRDPALEPDRWQSRHLCAVPDTTRSEVAHRFPRRHIARIDDVSWGATLKLRQRQRGVSDHVAGRRLGTQGVSTGGRSRHGIAAGDRRCGGFIMRAAQCAARRGGSQRARLTGSCRSSSSCANGPCCDESSPDRMPSRGNTSREGPVPPHCSPLGGQAVPTRCEKPKYWQRICPSLVERPGRHGLGVPKRSPSRDGGRREHLVEGLS